MFNRAASVKRGNYISLIMATDLVSRDWFGRFDSGEGESADLSCRFRKEEWHNLSGVLVKPIQRCSRVEHFRKAYLR